MQEGGGGGGTPRKFGVGMCAPLPNTLTLFKYKIPYLVLNQDLSYNYLHSSDRHYEGLISGGFLLMLLSTMMKKHLLLKTDRI